MMRGIAAAMGLALAALYPSVARAASCSNGIQDGGETDVDCGGIACPRCTSGRGCVVSTDCVSFVCTGGVCQPPSCVDGVRNGDELAVDCGGSTCSQCASCSCSLNTDCSSLVCQNCVCMAPTCTDGVKNGNEIAVDCGGTCVPCAPVPDGGTSDAMPADAGGSSPRDTGPPTLDASDLDASREAAAPDATYAFTRDGSSVVNEDSGNEARDSSPEQSTSMPPASNAPPVSPPSSTDSGTLNPASGPTLHGQSTEDSSGCGCRVGDATAPRTDSAMSLSALATLLVARRRAGRWRALLPDGRRCR